MKDLRIIDWSFKGERGDKIHSIHPYPAKFIQQLPKTLIENLAFPDGGDYILDPFCGSGVTLCEAQKSGIHSIGIDLNPIAALISSVKTTPLDAGFRNAVETIVEQCVNGYYEPTIYQFDNQEHWFRPEITRALGVLNTGIRMFSDSPFYQDLLFCFSSIIVRVSNQESDTRYAFKANKYQSDDVFRLFKQVANKLISAKNEMGYAADAEVILGNSLVETKRIPDGIGMVITSPPYPCAYEYWLYHKFRMYWLGYDPKDVKSQEIGTRSLYFKKQQEQYEFTNQMQELLNNLYPKCAEGAFLCFIIGRSKIHGKIYNNDEIIMQAGLNSGFHHVNTFSRTLDSTHKSFNLAHARIKEEYIVVLQR